jgi:oligosaccharide repeat unit polymerase
LLSFFTYKIAVRKSVFSPFFDLEKNYYQIASKRTSFRINILITFWLCFSILELFDAGNFPFFSLLGVGSYINYVDFGIGGLHGLLNAIYLFITCYIFLKYKVEKRKIYIFILLLLLMWPILLMTRQLLLSCFLQLFFIQLITTKINSKKLFVLISVVFIALFIFGYLGDLRSGREHIISLSQPTFEYPDYLPSFFIWVYMYIVTPLNNINHNILEISPLYFPYNTIISLFPSVLRESFSSFVGVKGQEFQLVSEAFNVSSFYKPFLIDFGYKLLPFILLILSFISLLVMHAARNKVVYVFILSIMLHNIVLSVFTNFITHIVFVFQMILPILIFKVKV